MSSMMDGVGYLVILTAFFGLPVALVFYGMWVAARHGTRPPAAQDSSETLAPPAVEPAIQPLGDRPIADVDGDHFERDDRAA